MIYERLDLIMKQINTKGYVKANELAQDFGVSLDTVRRDLESLEKKDLLRRVYGGAVSKYSKGVEIDYASRQKLHMDEKTAIGRKAAEFINNGDTIIIDLGTTTLEVAKCLRDKKELTCLTNSMPVASELIKNDNGHVILLGGELRGGYFSTSGSITNLEVDSFCMDKAIIGASGISDKNGVTDYHLEEANVRRKMIQKSELVILVADSSKIGCSTFVHVCSLHDIDILITDWNADPDILRTFETYKTEIVIAPRLPEKDSEG
jgi:DeoR/GlpR family transcriptional regulator of sugar metabolism